MYTNPGVEALSLADTPLLWPFYPALICSHRVEFQAYGFARLAVIVDSVGIALKFCDLCLIHVALRTYLAALMGSGYSNSCSFLKLVKHAASRFIWGIPHIYFCLVSGSLLSITSKVFLGITPPRAHCTYFILQHISFNLLIVC